MAVRHIVVNVDDDVEFEEIEGFKAQEDILDVYVLNEQIYIRHDKKICIKPVKSKIKEFPKLVTFNFSENEETDINCIPTQMSKYDKFERLGNLLLMKNNGYVINEQFQQIQSNQIKGDIMSGIIETAEGPLFTTFTSVISQNSKINNMYFDKQVNREHLAHLQC